MLDMVIVTAYFLMMLYLGWRSRRQSADAYWVAERKYGSSRITLSLVATVFGASSTMGIIGLGYSRGLTGAWWSLIGGICLIPFALLLASRVRALNVYTLPDILRRAYGDAVAIPAGLMIAVAWCGVIAAQLIAGSHLASGLFSIPFKTALPVVAVVFTLYTFWGGQLSVIKTDSWQLFLFIGGLFLSLLFLITAQTPTPTVWDSVPAGHWHFPVSGSFGWYEAVVFYPLIVGLPYLVGPDMYSRIFCARDLGVARRSALMAALIVIPLSFLLALMGLLARARFPEIAAEAALPTTLSMLIPMGLKGIIVAGFLGAIMSSADTCLISASTIITLNVIGPITRRTSTWNLMVSRIVVLALGASAWYVAGQQQGIISSLLLGYKVFVGGVVIPTLAAFFKEKWNIPRCAAVGAVIIGGGTAILANIQGGILLKTLLTPYGEALLQGLLGKQSLSLLPIFLSAFTLIGFSLILRAREKVRRRTRLSGMEAR